jgi:DNA ligase-1
MQLAQVVRTWQEVGGTRSRLAKAGLLARCLRGLAGPEIVPGVAYLQGELRQRQIGVGWASLRSVPPPAATATLTIAEVDAALATIGGQIGPGSQAARRQLLDALFARCTEDEQWFLRQLLTGELRQGALEGVMVEAVAKAAEVPVSEVRRARLLAGDLREVAVAALERGSAGLTGFRLTVGRPLAPMLAQPSPGIEAALEKVSPAAIEEKLDGARVQVHRDGTEVAVFTRSLDDITARVPELVEAALLLPAQTAVLDGEAIALKPDGRPHPFQITAGRIGSRTITASVRARTPLSWTVFDALHLGGADLLDRPGQERFAALAEAVSGDLLVRREVTGDPARAAALLRGALERGHEGVLVKSLDAPYEAGRRGGGWLKVKPSHTLDLVVLAAEWGHGRRQGWLSNLHLGARDPNAVVGEPGGFVMLGKTFKGMTDQLLEWQTAQLLSIAVDRGDWVVTVRPELVVEIAFDGVQSSSRYPGGVALRFARVKGYRPDKTAAEADTIDAIRAIQAGG